MAAPVITGLVDVVLTQGAVSAGVVFDIDANATATDAEQDYAGGTLTISGLLTGDTILFGGNLDIVEGGGSLSYLGTEFAVWSIVGSDVVIAFDADATDAAVTALLGALQFQSSALPLTIDRTLSFTLTDGAAETTSVNLQVVVIGDGGANNLLGTAGAETINGFADNDTLAGGDSDDRLYGGDGSDTLNGGTGSDLLHGGTGNDGMTGGDGDDTYIIDNNSDFVVENAGEGTDAVWVSGVDYSLGSEVENLLQQGTASINAYGNSLNNVMNGNGGVNTLEGQDGDDTLAGFGGADTLRGGNGVDILLGSAGNDILDGGAGADTMDGGNGNDEYTADDVGDVIQELTGSGIDHVTTSVNLTLGQGIENATIFSNSAVNVTGNALANTINGGANNNVIDGLEGRDVLNGGDGDDILNGGAGNDTLYGGNGQDTLNGEAGNDILYSGAGNETLAGGAGNDTYHISDASQVLVELAGEGTDTVHASFTYTLEAEIENLILGAGGLDGTGNAIANTITGSAGNNTLRGEGGNDRLFGGDGDDTLYGGDGFDTMTGGAGADRFTFIDDDILLTGQWQNNVVTDLNFGDGDVIDLSAIDADVNTGGDQAFTFVTGVFSKTAGEALINYDAGKNTTYIRLDVDGDGSTDFHLSIQGGDLTGATGNPGWLL